MSQTSIMLQLYACGQKFIEIFTLNVTENLKNAVPERVKENQITSIAAFIKMTKHYRSHL